MRDLLPVPGWLAGRGGRPEGYCHRQMIDAVRYRSSSRGRRPGCTGGSRH
ncbi:hypothetical protein [Streptomyces sp. NL15-2K]|nr:hypothetical protein [Streptomyces sp. NL15-2K]GCB44768.1 hypothetical protein SNL152K_2058 [Streptomyces sp. NL15-2K]